MNSEDLSNPPQMSSCGKRKSRPGPRVNIRRSLSVFLTVLMSLAAASCGLVNSGGDSSDDGGSSSGPIILGQTAPHSGESALLGDTTNGMRAYFDKVNAIGSITEKSRFT